MPRIVRVAVATVFGAIVAVSIPVVSVPVAGSASQQAAAVAAEPFQWQGTLSAGQSLEIKGVNGSIHAEPAPGDQAEVTADIEGSREDRAGVRVDVVEHEGGVTICAVYPTPPGQKPNECKPGREGRLNARDNHAKVNFRVLVPASVRLQARTVNGGIEAEGLQGHLDARSVNGSVSAKCRGIVQAETVNGSIEAVLGSADWEGTLAFETVNGSIDLALPHDASTQVQAETVNGQLESDFPVTMKGKFGPKHFTGTIGQGGRELHLKTVNGRIALRRAN
jgi:hypothetical protein